MPRASPWRSAAGGAGARPAAGRRARPRDSLAAMAERSRSLAKPDATDEVARVCAAVAGANLEGKQ